MDKTRQLIDQWIGDDLHRTKSVNYEQIADKYCDNQELIGAIFNVLDNSSYHQEYLKPICDQLFDYYRSRHQNLQHLALGFLPSLIAIHLTKLNAPTDSQRHVYQCVDVILLAIYNLQVVDDDGNALKRTIRVPTLVKPSIYHETGGANLPMSSTALTENAVQRHLENGLNDLTVPSFGPYKDHDQIVASTRWTIMTVLLKIYNQSLSQLPKYSLRALCTNCVKVLNHGRTNTPPQKSAIKNKNSTHNRIPSGRRDFASIIANKGDEAPLQPTSAFLIEMLNSIYFCMFNDLAAEGRQALQIIHNRAQYMLYSDVLIMSNAIRNSLRLDSTRESEDESPMGLSMALSPTSQTSVSNLSAMPAISKAAITNASFKTRKLAEDIPIVASTSGSTSISDKATKDIIHAQGTPTSGSTLVAPLSSINEEFEDLDIVNGTTKTVETKSDKEKDKREDGDKPSKHDKHDKSSDKDKESKSNSTPTGKKLQRGLEILKNKNIESNDSTLNKNI